MGTTAESYRVKLLLDEMYAPAIAQQLRNQKYNVDAIAVAERKDLIGLSDKELFRQAQIELRTLVTENVGDFLPLIQHYQINEQNHHGIIFTSNRRFPRSQPATTSKLIKSLARHVSNRQGHESSIHWLQ
jgi:hypothetical protein